MGNRATGWQVAKEEGRRWTRSEASSAIAAWRESGVSITRFADEHGLVAQRLYWWRNRLGSGAKAKEPVTRFVPVTVGSSSRVGAETRVVVSEGSLRIELESFDAASPEWIATVVRLSRESAR